MSKLEELVPPLELCKLIPKGEFEDTALVWLEVEIPQEDKKEWRVVNATKPILACHNPKHSAPTSEEIMTKLLLDISGVDVACFWDGGWHVRDTFNEAFDSVSIVTAALKLWLKMKGIDYE
jgi:hypothetical protein